MPFSETGIVLTNETQILRLTAVARAYDDAYTRDPKQGYRSIPYMENTPPEVLARATTKSTSLEIATTALRKEGIVLDDTVGELQRALGLTDEEMHDLACACGGHEVCASFMSHRVSELVDSRQKN